MQVFFLTKNEENDGSEYFFLKAGDRVSRSVKEIESEWRTQAY